MLGFGSKRNASDSRAGCSYVFGLGCLIVVLLLFNAWMVEVFLESNDAANKFGLMASQAAQFVVPVLLIFVQFWIFDLVVDLLGDRE